MAATVLQLFHDAITIHGFSQIHLELEEDNPERCINRGNFITRISGHNQHIERLWGEVIRCVVQHFRNIFLSLENEGVLDPANEVHKCALHYVYMPRINKTLDKFSNNWKYHLLSSAGNRSPYLVWHCGMVRLMRLDSASQELAGVSTVLTKKHKIPESWLTLCNHHLQEVSANISPLLDYVNEGKDVHKEALEKIDNAIENPCCNTT